jgi:hypothetical protein
VQPLTNSASTSALVQRQLFDGPVTYSAEGFLERDLDPLNPDFVSLLRGSLKPFVKELFFGKAIATQAHPRNEDTILAAQQIVKPMCALSMRKKHMTKRLTTVKEGEVEEKDGDDEKAYLVHASWASSDPPSICSLTLSTNLSCGTFSASIQTIRSCPIKISSRVAASRVR